MNAAQALSYLRSSGLIMLPYGENLRVEPSEKLNYELRALIKQHKAVLLTLLMQEAEEAAGIDWPEIKNSLNAILSVSMLTNDIRLRAQGEIPLSYTVKAHCDGCGEVFLPPSLVVSPMLMGCPWCFNRVRGLPIPKHAKDNS